MNNQRQNRYVTMCSVCEYIYEVEEGKACPLCAFRKQAKAYIGHPFHEQLPLPGMGYPMNGQGLPLSAGEKASVAECDKIWELKDDRD